MSVNFDQIQSTLGGKFRESSSSLEQAMSKVDLSKPEGMWEMQKSMQKWSMSIQLQSTMIKEMGDALKGVIQKMG
jgi:type III secretion protein F